MIAQQQYKDKRLDGWYNVGTDVASILFVLCHRRCRETKEYTLPKSQFREWGRLRTIGQKINFVNLQMEHIYGPDDGPEKFVSFLIHSMKSGAKEIDLTDGIQIRDFIHVDDAAGAYLAALKRLDNLTRYHSFEVGTAVSRTVREFVETIHREIGAVTNLNFGSVPRKDTDIMFSTARTEQLIPLG